MKSVNYQQNMNKLTLVKFRTFVCQKTPLREWKGKPENGRRYMSDKGLIYLDYIKNF